MTNIDLDFDFKVKPKFALGDTVYYIEFEWIYAARVNAIKIETFIQIRTGEKPVKGTYIRYELDRGRDSTYNENKFCKSLSGARRRLKKIMEEEKVRTIKSLQENITYSLQKATELGIDIENLIKKK